MKMYNNMLYYIVFLLNIVSYISASNIYHVGSHRTFHPHVNADYFGYSVLLSDSKLIVGAPKMRSRFGARPGTVYGCELIYLESDHNGCTPLWMGTNERDLSFRRMWPQNFFRDDMWFGATITSIQTGKLLICAPRWTEPYQRKHLLANGACIVYTSNKGINLMPLNDNRLQATTTDGRRKEYGEYGTHLNFYAYGQAGMSVKATENNTFIIGAPGLLQWTGGIIEYKFTKNNMIFSKQQITNPYFTPELGPDDYFGYSVESGIFDRTGKDLYVAGAPRSKQGFGQVLVFEPAIYREEPLKIRAKLRGPHLGSYFGASLCCADINGDGLSDLLVGAPTYVRKEGILPYDEGAVFVYLSNVTGSNFTLEPSGRVTGSEQSGARFGTAIAVLGDIDNDGYNDIAVGAPWENNGVGAVYIYRGSKKGLKPEYLQRIAPEGAMGFGISISKGYDVDNNKCNDLAVGAHDSKTAYIYRCIPTIDVHASIKVPDAMNLPQNATNFTAIFCVTTPQNHLWPHYKIDFTARITIDPEQDRAKITGDSLYTVTAVPGQNACDEQVVEVKPTADLSRPIPIKFDLEPIVKLEDNATIFSMEAVRLSEVSTLHSSFLIQLIRDCGEDMICNPWLVMTLEALTSRYIPGVDQKLGVKIKILNEAEPCYGAKVHLTLPLPPLRTPSECTLAELNMTCDVPAPLHRDEAIEWEIELEYIAKDNENMDLVIEALLEDSLYFRNISSTLKEELVIEVKPEANFTVSGKAVPNDTLQVTRAKLYDGEVITFVHYYEITNHGPSDWFDLNAEIILPDKVYLSSPIKSCVNNKCGWSIPAKVSLPVVLSLRFNLSEHGDYLNEVIVHNVTTLLRLSHENESASITTSLILDPKPLIWPLIVLGCVAGILILAVMVYIFYKYGFFSRQQHDDLKRLKEEEESSAEVPPQNDACSSSVASTSSMGANLQSMGADESSQELLCDSD